MLSAVAMPPLFFAGAMPRWRKHGFREDKSGGMAARSQKGSCAWAIIQVGKDAGAPSFRHGREGGHPRPPQGRTLFLYGHLVADPAVLVDGLHGAAVAIDGERVAEGLG